jgi:hypothetical protein
MTLKKVLENAMDYIAAGETQAGTGRDTKQYRDLAAAYETICDNAAVAGIEVSARPWSMATWASK